MVACRAFSESQLAFAPLNVCPKRLTTVDVIREITFPRKGASSGTGLEVLAFDTTSSNEFLELIRRELIHLIKPPPLPQRTEQSLIL